MKVLCVLGIMTILWSRLLSQDFNATLLQYKMQPQLPASASLGSTPSIFLMHQRCLFSGQTLQSSALSFTAPIRRNENEKTPNVGVGGFINSKTCTSDWLKSTSAAVSFGYKLTVNKRAWVDFGIQPQVTTTRTAINQVTTGNQWIAAEFRHDPSASIGENVINTRQTMFTINASLRWSLIDYSSRSRLAISLVGGALNKPKSSFVGDAIATPVTYTGILEGIIYDNQRLQVGGVVACQATQSIIATNVQVAATFKFENDNPLDLLGSGSLGLLSKAGNSGIVGNALVFAQPDYSVAFACNYPIKSTSMFFGTSYEFGINVRLKRKKTVSRSPASKTRTRSFNTNELETEQRKVDGVRQLENELKSVDNIKSVRFELEKNFNFRFGDVALNDEAKAYLDNIVRFMQNHDEYSLEIIGHTDNSGSDRVNEKLSAARAAAVLHYLVEKGISISRISSKGRGDREPMAPNDTEGNRSRNRRVQFILYIERR